MLHISMYIYHANTFSCMGGVVCEGGGRGSLAVLMTQTSCYHVKEVTKSDSKCLVSEREGGMQLGDLPYMSNGTVFDQ